jgi:hypothetical protein
MTTISTRAKLVAAAVGGSAVIAMGAFSLAVTQEQAGSVTAAKSNSMNLGPTATMTTPPAIEATQMAVPAIKGPAPLPAEEQAAE